ncbi:hypothetical protein GM708_08295 [Vibrio cholerae]|nr:hypothetical protein [Vibrio cholerae]
MHHLASNVLTIVKVVLITALAPSSTWTTLLEDGAVDRHAARPLQPPAARKHRRVKHGRHVEHPGTPSHPRLAGGTLVGAG